MKHTFSKKVCCEEEFNLQELHISSSHVRYKNIRADKIIFCDGAAGGNNPWF